MEKSTSPYSTAHHPFDRIKRRHLMLVLIIIFAAVFAGGWLLYDKVFRIKNPEQAKQAVLEQIAKDSPAVPEETRAGVLEELAKEMSATRSASSLNQTEEEREAILNSLVQ